MRRLKKGKRGKPRKKIEPLAEGIRKTKRGRDWKSMSDDQIVDFARGVIEEKGLKGRQELKGADSGLYGVLWMRKLLDRVIPQPGKRSRGFFTKRSDEEVVDFARTVLEEHGLEKRGELHKFDSRLYYVLRKRKLLDRVIPESAHSSRRESRDWASMSDEELVSFASRFKGENGIKTRKDLRQADDALYIVLFRRELLDAVGFDDIVRDWNSMSDDDIIKYAKDLAVREGITGRRKLMVTDKGLYEALRKRGLVGSVIPKSTKSGHRDWTSMSDEELVAFANDFLRENAIGGRGDLDEADTGLYKVLGRRKLLDRVFAPIESQKKREAVQDVVDAVEEF